MSFCNRHRRDRAKREARARKKIRALLVPTTHACVLGEAKTRRKKKTYLRSKNARTDSVDAVFHHRFIQSCEGGVLTFLHHRRFAFLSSLSLSLSLSRARKKRSARPNERGKARALCARGENRISKIASFIVIRVYTQTIIHRHLR